MRIVRASTISTTHRDHEQSDQGFHERLLLLEDERRRALDPCYLDPRARLEHLALHERPGRPDLAADLHLAAEVVHAFGHDSLGADERGRSGAKAAPECAGAASRPAGSARADAIEATMKTTSWITSPPPSAATMPASTAASANRPSRKLSVRTSPTARTAARIDPQDPVGHRE